MLKKSIFALLFGAAFFIGTTACGGEKVEEIQEADTTEESHEGHSHDAEAGHEGHDHAAESTEATAMAFYCPMECEGDKTYAETGSCPVCGMDLVEKK